MFQIGSIIVAPTRVLASQIYDVLLKFLEHLPQFTSLLLIGGGNPAENIKNFLQNGYIVAIVLMCSTVGVCLCYIYCIIVLRYQFVQCTCTSLVVSSVLQLDSKIKPVQESAYTDAGIMFCQSAHHSGYSGSVGRHAG